MSENKKVIRVKDLVIKADNVYIEPQKRRERDPFFGGLGRERDLRDDVEDFESDNKVLESSSKDFVGADRDDRDDRKDDRRPFSWI
ncbi:hypothetical protein ACFSTA_16910 [Ornithinibacillus salinisoli]|uniref:Uncharacterized protein n=1 Tax=Ornithinibacillus salinisoli TaxID=1848459 RepID=A0ABW4W1S3_9BACI